MNHNNLEVNLVEEPESNRILLFFEEIRVRPRHLTNFSKLSRPEWNAKVVLYLFKRMIFSP